MLTHKSPSARAYALPLTVGNVAPFALGSRINVHYMFLPRKKQFYRSTSAFYVTNWCACCLRPNCLMERSSTRLPRPDRHQSWRRHYNTERPHGSLGYKPPAPEVFIPAFAARAARNPNPARASREANHQLTFALDQSLGADQPHGWLQTRPAPLRRWPRRWQREYRLVMSRLDAHCLPQSEVESAFDATPSPSTRAKAA